MIWGLDVRRTVVEGVQVFCLEGRLGQLGAGELLERVVADIPKGAAVVVDMSAIDYASSAGLTALDALAGRVLAGGSTLVLCGLTEPVRLALDLAGMLPHFLIEDTLSAAIALVSRDAQA